MQFTLRPWTLDDLDSLVKYANNPRVAQNLMNRFPHPYTEANGKVFIGMAMGSTPANILAIEVEGSAAGGIGLHPLDDVYCKNAELGYWLGEPHWGKGYMSEAVKGLLGAAFLEKSPGEKIVHDPRVIMNTRAMIEEAGLGVAYRAKPALKEVADARIEHHGLDALLWAQGIRKKEWLRG